MHRSPFVRVRRGPPGETIAGIAQREIYCSVEVVGPRHRSTRFWAIALGYLFEPELQAKPAGVVKEGRFASAALRLDDMSEVGRLSCVTVVRPVLQ